MRLHKLLIPARLASATILPRFLHRRELLAVCGVHVADPR